MVNGCWEGPTDGAAAGGAAAMKARNTMFRAGWLSGRYWDRTSDLFRVREARYRCANRAYNINVLLRGEDGIRTRVHGFAGRCLTTRPPHRIRSPEGNAFELLESLRAVDET